MKSFENMEKELLEVVKDGFTPIPLEERKKQIEEQKKKKGWNFGLTGKQRLKIFNC